MSVENRPSIFWVSGMWSVEDNPKRSPKHYQRLIPKTASLLAERQCAFWFDSQHWEHFLDSHLSKTRASYRLIRGEAADLVLQDLQLAVKSSAIRRLDRDGRELGRVDLQEKDSVHFTRDLVPGGIETYVQLVTTWLAKIFAVVACVRSFGFEDDKPVAWVDASFSRFVPEWREGMKLCEGSKIKSGCVSHIRNSMKYQGQPLAASATVLIARVDTWMWLHDEFPRVALDLYRDEYLHDEETIINHIRALHPNRFQTVSISSLLEPPDTRKHRWAS